MEHKTDRDKNSIQETKTTPKNEHKETSSRSSLLSINHWANLHFVWTTDNGLNDRRSPQINNSTKRRSFSRLNEPAWWRNMPRNWCAKDTSSSLHAEWVTTRFGGIHKEWRFGTPRVNMYRKGTVSQVWVIWTQMAQFRIPYTNIRRTTNALWHDPLIFAFSE